MEENFQVEGQNASALFTLKLHRGDGMALLAMNWKDGTPPDNFVGFAIEYKEPGGSVFYTLKNRLCFPGKHFKEDSNRYSTLRAPIQKFRWVHFPRNANLAGLFTYRVTPVFMNELDELSYGDAQTIGIELRRETYPGQLNVAFTRGFVSSQAFVDRFHSVSKLLPARGSEGLNFTPTHPKTREALSWMGFEAREVILDILDRAVVDRTAQVRVIAYDLNEPDVITRLEMLGQRLKVIIDDSGDHGKRGSAENQAAKMLSKSAGAGNVKRQHMGQLQHNKTIAVTGQKVKSAVCGSTNFSWRGFFVQNNNALVVEGEKAVAPFLKAFENYWNANDADSFRQTDSPGWTGLGLTGIDAMASYSPHGQSNSILKSVADDIAERTTSSLFYSLAFLYESRGPIKDAILKITKNKNRFVYGISDRKVGGLTLQKANGNLAPVYPKALSRSVPEPFKREPTGGAGVRMHHKFVVIDFDKPTARVYLGSHNFSGTADMKNGENLLLIRDRRIAVSYMIEALCMIDHYHFRVCQEEGKRSKKRLALKKPPRKRNEKAWWEADYTDPVKIRDREMFS